MLKSYQMRSGEYGPFQYRIMEYDEVTQSLLPVDLTGKTVTCNIYQLQQSEGTFTEFGFATGLPCEILDADDGWVETEFPSMDRARFRIEYEVTDADMKRVYPRFTDQMVDVN